MANIHIPKPWERISPKATEEKIYQDRRQILKQLGLIGAGSLLLPTTLSACMNPKDGQSSQMAAPDQQAPDFHFEGEENFYPAKRNERYTLDRPLTEEYTATHYNNFYEFISPKDRNIYNAYKYVGKFDTSDWQIEIAGHVEKKGKMHLGDIIKEMGTEERTYRFRCVERWSMAVPWTGFSLAKFIQYLQPTDKAKYIKFTSFASAKQMPGVANQDWYPWPYYEGLRMDEAMNEVALLATGIYGKPLPKQNGAPVRLVVPWKYGYKNIKSIVKMEFVSKQPQTFWNTIAPSEYPFVSNVNPAKPHPRWSQAQERMIPDGEPRPTLPFNGYGEFVASLYK
ncbi:protein-methionine-sulfoxide reductase catalytic subunit MsrP [Pontibacter sp. G13]|uniref:protein-methionine-sulfoxide reductase catalytic subunit MsrP n=1 Tax=Pontibacter sp. G13 TaxID=3074898 RepID=UPI00288AA70E|nr:protein-methionine-sulfoxide reductase catalytic subunit MsrP [Pontibacter sp. G13]WNJ16116.1 protein-methionine-sulfoxide reductase catalytic subunit MsrP [Pontibacter sp. G13]